MNSLFRCFALVVLLLGTAACAGQPYVLDADEFDRSSGDFGQDPSDLSSVKICYSSSSTSPDVVRALAVAACGKFGKTAEYVDQDYLSCPLVTPVSANFNCLGAEEAVGTAFDPYATYYFQNQIP